jgi:hypothetical protein
MLPDAYEDPTSGGGAGHKRSKKKDWIQGLVFDPCAARAGYIQALGRFIG